MNQCKWLGILMALVGLVSCGGGSDAPAPATGKGSLELLTSVAAPPRQGPQDALLRPAAAAQRSILAGAPAITVPAFLDWAERSFPQYFPAPAQAVIVPGWVIRFYPPTSIYLGVRDDGAVFAMLGANNNQILALYTLADYTCMVSPASCTSTSANLVGLDGIAAWDALAADQKARVNTTMRSFFLHQSVGGDLEDGAQAIGYKFEYADSHATSLAAGLNGGLFSSSNGDYAGKIAEFRSMALANRTGLGVAIMKFGYADIVADKLAGAQAEYLAAVNALRAQGVRVLHVTPPLVYNAPGENAPKMQMRAWMLSTFTQDTIFDLEDVESIDPATGARCERGGSWEICDAVRSTAACPSLGQGVDAPSGQGHLCFNPHAQRFSKAFLYAIYRAQL